MKKILTLKLLNIPFLSGVLLSQSVDAAQVDPARAPSAAHAVDALAADEGKRYQLDPSQRPRELEALIDQTFTTIEKGNFGWNYNGDSQYYFLWMDSAKLVEAIIKASPHQKEFFLLDIGAGDFSWGRATAAYINKQKDIPADVTVHILSVRGESYPPYILKSGRCKIYNIGSFKIEDFNKSLDAIQGDLKLLTPPSFDLIVSRYTFFHLHDPVGTFIQAYNHLRPETGLMLMHDFPVYFENKDFNQTSMPLFLSYTQAPFLLGGDKMQASFLLKRPNEALLELPLAYGGLLFQKTESFNKHVPYFLRDKNIPHQRGIFMGLETYTVHGNHELYEWVNTHCPEWRETNRPDGEKGIDWKPLLFREIKRPDGKEG